MACPFLEDPVEEGARIIQRAFRPPAPKVSRPLAPRVSRPPAPRVFRPPAPRVFRDRINPLAFPDDYLWEKYRFSRPSIVYLCDLLEPHLSKSTQRSQALTPVQSVCIALRFFASGTFLYSVGDAEHLGKSTVCREIRRVYLALRQFLNIFVTFPGHQPTQRIKEDFYAIAGFPNVLGTIDCTHVRIQAPTGPMEADYVNKKSFHSLNIQMICDGNCLITNVEAKWPGSVHDSRIFQASSLAHKFAEGEFNGVLLGHRGYVCLPYLLTPFPEPQTAAEKAFNAAHSRTRAQIEKTFGQLKSRFGCLKSLRVRPDRACNIVVACAVLHNIAHIRRERLPTPVAEEEQWEDLPAPEDGTDGRSVRDFYRDSYFTITGDDQAPTILN